MCPIRISFWDTEELFQELFKDLFNEIKGFKYQITVKVLLIKYRINIDKEFAPVYFNSAPRTVINSEYMLDKFFQETLYVIDNWISEGSGRVIESIEAQYMKIFIYSPLIGSRYIELPYKFKKPMRVRINIKNNNNKYFLWCRIRHPKGDKNMVNDPGYEVIKFPISEKDFRRSERQNSICINVFSYENNPT